MQPRTLYWSPAAASANGFCLSQTPIKGPLTFTGALAGNAANGDVTDPVAGGCSQRRIRITCAADETGHTILLVGTRAKDGFARLNIGAPVVITETVALGTAGTFDTLQDFATLTAAPVISANATGAIQIGTSPVASTPWQQNDDHLDSPENIGLFIILDAGAQNFTIEHTLERLPKGTATAGTIPRVLPHSVIVTKSASVDGNYAFPITAQRLTTNSGNGLLRYSWRQAGVIGN